MKDTTPTEQAATQQIKHATGILSESLARAVVLQDLYERVHGCTSVSAEHHRGEAMGLRSALYHLDVGTFDQIDTAAETAWPDAMAHEITTFRNAAEHCDRPEIAAALAHLADVGTDMLAEHHAANLKKAS